MISKFRNTIVDVLNGPPNDDKGNCDGLVWSLQLGQSIIAKEVGISHALPRQLPVYNPVGNSLSFHSFKSTGVPGYWDRRFRLYKTITWGPKRIHFYSIPGVNIPSQNPGPK